MVDSLNNKVKIEIWQNQEGFCHYLDSFNAIKSERTKDRISKRNRFFEQLEFRQLMRDRSLMEKVKVRGLEDLLELKYLITPPFRSICIIWKEKLVLLMLMSGSGSDGRLTRFVQGRAKIIRSMIEYWKKNN